MDDNLLLLNSLGRYTETSENAAEKGACPPRRKRQREESQRTKSVLLRSRDSHLNIVVKNEPEEDDSWDPELSADTDLPPDESSQSQQGAERQRNVRFSDEENDVLIRGVLPHYDKLFGRLASRHPTSAKNAAWREVTREVNAVSACPRSVQNCKKRFADIKRKVKEKLSRADRQRREGLPAGGGARANVSFWPYERVMEKIIAADSIVPGVPGTTDSDRVTEHDGSDFQEEEGEDGPTSLHNDEQEEFPEEADAEADGQPEEASRHGPPPLRAERASGRGEQTLRDHAGLIYAEQSHFRRTVAQKFNILNSNVRALNRNLKALQESFGDGMAALAQSVQQQNAILDKLSSNLLLLAEQQQQHNKQCMSGMQQVLHHLDVHRVSPSPTPSDSDSSPLPADARRGTHWRRVRRRSKSQISPEPAKKKGRR